MYIKDLDAWAGGFNSRAAPQLFECHVDLEGVNHRHATRGVEFVAAKAAQMANEGEKGECRECLSSGLLARKRTLALVRGPA